MKLINSTVEEIPLKDLTFQIEMNGEELAFLTACVGCTTSFSKVGDIKSIDLFENLKNALLTQVQESHYWSYSSRFRSAIGFVRTEATRK